MPFRIYRRNHILRQTGLLVFGECSRKGKRRFLRDSKPSTLISHGVAISQIPGPSPRFALSPSFFAFSLSSASLSFPLSRVAIYSYLLTYVRTYVYYVAAGVSFLFSVPTTLCFGRTTRRLFQTVLIIIDLETRRTSARRSFDLRRKEIMVAANCVHIDKVASEDANDRILFVSCSSFFISLGIGAEWRERNLSG